MISLTANACLRLRNAADDAILTAQPVVRVLFLDSVAARGDAQPGIPVGYKAFVYDGTSYVYIALAAHLSAKIGDADGLLHVGSAVSLDQMLRLPNGPPDCPVFVTAFTIQFAEGDPDSPPLIYRSLRPDAEGTGSNTNYEVHRLIAERDSERNRRLVLEHLLQDICRRDIAPGDRVRVVPAVYDALMKMAELAEGLGGEEGEGA
ncbi:hypothetical protein BV20DRAFT_698140 [Pilatotrama ljubarskyi]|nr:hypothetical protein BV20DRAFT_698140 [Pilatotrama ljubarskyi]